MADTIDEFLEENFPEFEEADEEPRKEREQQIDTTRFSGDALTVGAAANGVIEDFKDLFTDVRSVFREQPKTVKDRADDKLSDLRSEMKARLKEFRRKVKRAIQNDSVNFEDMTDLDGDVDLLRDELLEGWTKLQNVRRSVLQDVDNEMKERIGEIRRELKSALREINEQYTVVKNKKR